MLQGRLEGVALAFVNLPVSGWQGQVVILQKISKNARIVCAFLGRLVLPYAFVASLGERQLNVGVSKKE